MAIADTPDGLNSSLEHDKTLMPLKDSAIATPTTMFQYRSKARNNFSILSSDTPHSITNDPPYYPLDHVIVIIILIDML